ncbi:DUF3169 family protein [Clostridium sp. JNZ J1-5]
MKKYKNFIIIIIISGLFGGLVGFFSGNNFCINLNLGGNIYVYLFRVLLGIEIILTLIVSVILIFLKSKFKTTDLEELPLKIDRKIDLAIHLSTVAVILGLSILTIMVSKNFTGDKKVYITITAVIIVVTNLLQILSIKCYNGYYPDKKLNMFENNSDKKYFDKLDEGEKWIAYSSSYKSFRGMQLVYSGAMVLMLVLSAVTSVPIIMPIVIAILWIIQISIYMIATRKYSK